MGAEEEEDEEEDDDDEEEDDDDDDDDDDDEFGGAPAPPRAPLPRGWFTVAEGLPDQERVSVRKRRWSLAEMHPSSAVRGTKGSLFSALAFRSMITHASRRWLRAASTARVAQFHSDSKNNGRAGPRRCAMYSMAGSSSRNCGSPMPIFSVDTPSRLKTVLALAVNAFVEEARERESGGAKDERVV